MTDEAPEIEVTPHQRWFPLPVTAPIEEVTASLPASGDGDEAADQIAFLTGASIQLQEVNPTQEGVVNLAVFALLSESESLVARAVATLRGVVVDEGTTAEEVARLLVADEQLFEDPTFAEIETMSGDALSARMRPMLVEDDGSTRVHEVVAVVWVRPKDLVAYTLTAYVDDLVDALEVGDLLDELAVGIKGL